MTFGATRRLKDPAQLTPYEERLLELKKSGLTYKEIAKTISEKCKVGTITSRYKIIKEKLSVSDIDYASSL